MEWTGSEGPTGYPNGTGHGGNEPWGVDDPPIVGTKLSEVYLPQSRNHDYTLEFQEPNYNNYNTPKNILEFQL